MAAVGAALVSSCSAGLGSKRMVAAAGPGQMTGEGMVQLRNGFSMVRVARPVRPQIRMGNPAASSKGIFAPLVVIARNILGKKRFNQLRGKGIALHSQVITEFCKSIGADSKQRQGLIRLAKKNGEKLGFLA
ncbi:hypothetical protein R1flu_005699 [Riccia fluitans]|uniref:Proton gradient regulation 5 n=1 Tax=Riccia fluitans TaxID=41844 RepID=A0ABD1YTW8_9MARC